jgi:glutamyl/glutaminyl-tRNA synthetase
MITRFAPAPTGFLHLGHVVNAIHVWNSAREAGGKVLLRIEDHDRRRSRPEYERAILDDLDWLGFVPDRPSTEEFRNGRCEGRQSDRGEVYEAALDRLRSLGLVYACGCTRSDLGASDATGERRYPGTCATKRLAEKPGVRLRVRLDPVVEHFVDRARGPQSQQPSDQCGDLLIRDRDGNWTYQFAAVVDDLEQGITLVVRGEDLLPSTGRQIQLSRLLGRAAPPEFLHHALVMKPNGRKLSKSDGDTGVRDLRAKGWTPAQAVDFAKQQIGSSCAISPVR